MRCIICSIGKLEIVNSRKNQAKLEVWRRRKCSECQAMFTTKELPEFDRAFYIQAGKRKKDLKPFEKTSLLLQLLLAGGHMKKQQDLLWLAETIANKAFVQAAQNDFTIDEKDYQKIALQTLSAYDKLLAANFAARNPAE